MHCSGHCKLPYWRICPLPTTSWRSWASCQETRVLTAVAPYVQPPL